MHIYAKGGISSVNDLKSGHTTYMEYPSEYSDNDDALEME